MSAYSWPTGGRKTMEMRDDPRGRAGFLAPRRREIDPEGALEATRTLAPPPPRRRRGRAGAPAAPADTSRTDLWVPIGPSTVVHGQATGSPRITGRVRALAVDDSGERVYAAAANGGIWYSGDGGGSWTSLGGLAVTPTSTVTHLAHRNSCGAIAVVFGSSKATDLVYVGTGEPGWQKGQPGGKLGGYGVLRAEHPVTTGGDDPWTLEARNLEGAGVYRLAVQPGGTGVLAATTQGLFTRPTNPADPWPKVTGSPFASYSGAVTDVLWTKAGGGLQARQWVWAATGDGDVAGLWFRNGDSGDFTRVTTTGAVGQLRAVLAAPDPATTVYVFNNTGDTTPAKLFRVDATASPVSARSVQGMPTNVVGDQGEYDLCVAVDPSSPADVVVGGSAVRVNDPAGNAGGWNGAIFRGTVSSATPPRFTGSTHIGIGVHSDVHTLVFAKDSGRLFTGCDGGVFRSDDPTKPAGFYARNDGLAVIQANYLGAHPRCEGYLVCGLQDNGIIEMASSSVWNHTGAGDGGSVVLDPARPDHYFRQFFSAGWTQSPIARGGAAASAPPTDVEFKASSFYSQAAANLHTRGTTTVSQLLVPTTRVWLTEDFGTTWVTLPTGRDAFGPYVPGQDKLASKILVCEWQDENTAWVLSEDQVHRLVRVPGSDSATSVGTWSMPVVLDRGRKRKKDATTASNDLRKAAVWSDLCVNLDAGGTAHGPKGAVYLGTAGHPTDADVDTLWWFDGDKTWHPTKLRKKVPAPVTAVLADPTDPDVVWVGTTVGVFRGARKLTGPGAPRWDWTALVRGLPEAPVEDLALFDQDGIRLLRAGIVARGVWELRLGSDVRDMTYLRCHDDDLRYREEAELHARDLTTERSWHGSPDIRPRPATVALPPPTDLDWTFGSPPSSSRLRRFQASARHCFDDPRFRASGEWDRYFDEALKDNGAPVSGGGAKVTQAFYDSVVNGFETAEPWTTTVPTLADLLDVGPTISEGGLRQSSLDVTRKPYKIDVVVHRRGLAPIGGAQVRVTLLRWVDPATRNRADPTDSTTWPTSAVTFAAAVNEVLNSSGGTFTTSPGPGWSFLGTNAAARRKTLTGQTLDNTTPGVATFDLDFGGFAANRLVLLVAVIKDDATSVIVNAPLRDLARGNAHVAVRSLKVRP